MNKKQILKLQNICKDYKQGKKLVEVLKNINLTIYEGEIAAIIGSSGSGKSTLLHIAGLLDSPDSGDVMIDDIINPNITNAYFQRLTKIGFVYQHHHLLKDFSAIENVSMPLLLQGVDKEFAFEEANKLLLYLGLGNRLFNLPGELSGGEQQRVAIARSVINNPALILADEPTGNLDNDTTLDVFNMFLDLAAHKKAAVVMVTHNLELANKIGTYYELRNANLVQIK